MKPLVGILNIALATAAHEKQFALMDECNRGVVSNMMQGVEEIIGFHGQYRWFNLTKWFSQTFIRPVLQKNAEQKGKSLIAMHEELELHKLASIALYLTNPATTAWVCARCPARSCV